MKPILSFVPCALLVAQISFARSQQTQIEDLSYSQEEATEASVVKQQLAGKNKTDGMNRPDWMTDGNRPDWVTAGNRPDWLTDANRPDWMTDGNRPNWYTNGKVLINNEEVDLLALPSPTEE